MCQGYGCISRKKKYTSADLKRLFTVTGIRGMLEGKDYLNVDSVYPFVAAPADRATGFTEKNSMTIVHSKFSGLPTKVMNRELCNGFASLNIRAISLKVTELKTMVVRVFHKHCNNGPLTLKYHLLAHLRTDLERLGRMEMLDSSPIER